ncbi:MAG: hypothetical protein K8H86_06885 [Ignavibacteriaceae bacterium]|nr:hypothetical protein [Ignavibacteriaceae bacterium]
MFEKEIQFISDFTLNKIKKLGPFFTFEKLFNAEVHPAIVQYISAELDYLIYEDRQKLLSKSVFDYSGSEITKHFLAIGQEIKKSKKVSYQDVKNLVVQAVSFNINFTVRPRWSISKLAFDKDEFRTAEEINIILSYIYYYDYIRNVVNAYIRKKGLVNISASDFSLVLGRLDKELFTVRTTELIDNSLYAIADFTSIGGLKKKTVPVSSIEMFLKEKNLIDYLFKLRRAMPSEAKQKYTVEEIRRVLYSSSQPDEKAVLPSQENVEIETPEDQQDELVVEEEIGSGIFETDEPEEVNLEEPDDADNSEEINKDYSGELEVESTIESVGDNKGKNGGETDTKKIIENEDNTEDFFELTDSAEALLNELSEDTVVEKKEDFLDMFNKELDELTKNDIDIQSDAEELEFDLTNKEHLDSLYDFEDEPDSVLDNTFDEEETETDEFNFDDDEKLISLEAELNINNLKTDDENTELDLEKIADENISALASPTPVREKDIFVYMTDKEIDKLVENIFNEDRDDFATTMEKITECSSYEEATEILKGVFFTYRVNPYSRDAVTLTNAVSNYFEQA